MFTVKLVFQLLNNSSIGSGTDWAWLWKVKGPEKMKTLLWLAWWGRMHTRRVRARRGLADNDLCHLCLNESEDDAHVRCDCNWAKEV